MALVGYTQLPTGEWTKDLDASGPYVFNGSAMVLKATGTGGGGGGGDASAANQTIQITAEQAIQAGVGATADAVVAAGAAGSLSAKLRAISRDLVANIVLAAGANIVGKVGIDQTTPGTTNKVSIGTDGVLAAGSAIIGKVGIDQTTPGTTNAIDLKTINGGTAVTAGNGVSGTGVLRVTLASDSTGQVAAVGKAAAGSSISGAPVLLGGAARTANPTAVTDGQAANIMTDKMGRLVIVQGHVRDLVASAVLTLTSTTSPTTLIASGGAGVFTDITHLSITNSSATATLVTLSDGTTSYVWSIAAGGGAVLTFHPPLKATSTATAWTLACGTSVASVYAVANYVKNL